MALRVLTHGSCCAVLIGVSMGLLAFLVDIVLQRLNSFKFGAVRSVVSNHGGFWAPYMVWLCFTMGYAALSAYLVTSFAPLGAGSGIPEIKTYLNGVHIKGKLTTGLCTHPPQDCPLPSPLLPSPLPCPPLPSPPQDCALMPQRTATPFAGWSRCRVPTHFFSAPHSCLL